jgi:hypothetical protein
LTGDKSSTYFRYQFGSDPYPNAQDAAKLFIPAGHDLNGDGAASASIPTTQQLRMSLPTQITSGTLLLTWDWYWGPEFRANRGGMNFYKMFHFLSGGKAWWTMLQAPAWASTTVPTEAAKVWDSFWGDPLPNGAIQREPWHPTGLGAPDQRNKSGEQVAVFHGRWTRYWVEIKLLQPPEAFTDWKTATGATVQPNANDPEGRWHMVSQWVADEGRDPQRVLYRIPVSFNANTSSRISRFDFEMNTSQGSGFIGPWVGYGRNVVVLHNYSLPAAPESDKFIFQRPVK